MGKWYRSFKKEEENSKTESESGKASEEGVAETETNAAVEVVKETIDLIDFNASSIIEKSRELKRIGIIMYPIKHI